MTDALTPWEGGAFLGVCLATATILFCGAAYCIRQNVKRGAKEERLQLIS